MSLRIFSISPLSLGGTQSQAKRLDSLQSRYTIFLVSFAVLLCLFLNISTQNAFQLWEMTGCIAERCCRSIIPHTPLVVLKDTVGHGRGLTAEQLWLKAPKALPLWDHRTLSEVVFPVWIKLLPSLCMLTCDAWTWFHALFLLFKVVAVATTAPVGEGVTFLQEWVIVPAGDALGALSSVRQVHAVPWQSKAEVL